MNAQTTAYRDWILSQHIAGCEITPQNDNVAIETEQATGYVNFYDIDGSVIVEMRLTRKADDEPAFFLHFELEDQERAQELFGEMVLAIEDLREREKRHVLLCCSCGITTTFFADKLNQCAQQQKLDYDFAAKPLVDAQREGKNFAAVLLAPQVGHQRKQVAELMPKTPVLELPARIFGAYDAPAALELVRDVLEGSRKAAAGDLRMARAYDDNKRVLAVSFVYRKDEPTLSYQVLDHGKEALSGMSVLKHFQMDDVTNLAATLRLKGWEMSDFDAVGIAIPGRIDGDLAIFDVEGTLLELAIAEECQHAWGVPVYVDNDATAAAAGCYVSQDTWDYVGFHAQTLGIVECAQGFVHNGNPLYGHKGFTGSLAYLAKGLSLSMEPQEAAWRYDGMRELVSLYLAVTACTIAPEAIFVWCDLLTDMDELRASMRELVPDEAIPELVAVSNYDELILLGELALCLQRLAQKD